MGYTMGKKAEKYTEKVGLTVSEVLEMIEETVEAAASTKRKSRKKKEEEVAAPVKTKEERLNDLITKGKVPAFLGSSFAFLGGFATMGSMNAGIYENMPADEKLAYALGGVVIAGLVYLVLAAIIKAEGFEATEEEIEAEYAKTAAEYDMEVDMVKKYVNAEQIKDQLVTNKAIATVVDSAVVIKPEKKAKKAEQETENAAE